MSSAALAPVAVVDQGVPIYACGVAEVLRSSGLDVTQTDQPLPWASGPGDRALVVVVRSDEDWLLLQGLANIPGSLLVAVLVEPDLEVYRRAVNDVGALTAIGWNAEPHTLIEFVTAAAAGYRLLPRSIALALSTTGAEPVPDWYRLDAEDLYLLQGLRAGKTQVTMGHHLGRTDRSIRHRLTALYKKLDVRNGCEAIAKSANWDLEPP